MMDSSMYNINNGEILVRVRRYELIREDGRIHIDVSERIAGRSHHKVMAFPFGFTGSPEEGYCGFGHSEEEALRGFLNRIKEVSTKDILESVKN